MKIDVVFKDNNKGQVDEVMLDEMLSKNLISMFRRSNGWAMADVDETRGYSRMTWKGLILYTGPDRRSMSDRIINDCSYFRFVA